MSRPMKMLRMRRAPVYGAELITNGTFTTNANNWVTNGATIAASAGQATVTLNQATGSGNSEQSVGGLTNGKTYQLSYYAQNGTGTVSVAAQTGATSGVIASGGPSTAGAFTFVAPAGTVFIALIVTGANGTTGVFDNISLKQVS